MLFTDSLWQRSPLHLHIGLTWTGKLSDWLALVALRRKKGAKTLVDKAPFGLHVYGSEMRSGMQIVFISLYLPLLALKF